MVKGRIATDARCCSSVCRFHTAVLLTEGLEAWTLKIWMWQPYHEQWEAGLRGIGTEFPWGPGITDLKPVQGWYSAVIHGDLRRFHVCKDVPLDFCSQLWAVEPELLFPPLLSPSANKSSLLFADPLWWLSPHCSRGDRLLEELLSALDAAVLQLH